MKNKEINCTLTAKVIKYNDKRKTVKTIKKQEYRNSLVNAEAMLEKWANQYGDFIKERKYIANKIKDTAKAVLVEFQFGQRIYSSWFPKSVCIVIGNEIVIKSPTFWVAKIHELGKLKYKTGTLELIKEQITDCPF